VRILKDLECTEIVQLCKGNILRARTWEGYVHPHVFAKSADLTDFKGFLKSRDAKECVSY